MKLKRAIRNFFKVSSEDDERYFHLVIVSIVYFILWLIIYILYQSIL
jgi:hypothetical protein